LPRTWKFKVIKNIEECQNKMDFNVGNYKKGNE
jgi:hypothetical protein